MLQAIIWDFDGTICDTYPEITRTITLALQQFNARTSPEHITNLACISLDHCIAHLAKAHQIDHTTLDQAFSETYKTVDITQQAPFDGLTELCDWLTQHGVQHYIVTHRRRKSLTELLNQHALSAYFTDIITGDDGFPKKPAPDAMLHLLRIHHLSPEHTIVVGDRDIDILAGQAAQLPTYLFQSTFPMVKPTAHFRNYAQLKILLQNR